jgi:hypothetical protein
MSIISVGVVSAIAGLALVSATPTHADPSDGAHDRAWMLEHLGASGLEKCRAFSRVRQDAEQLQKTDGGRLSSTERQRLQVELNAAKAMPPGAVTAQTCGSAL